jgi:hypothetical protein
MEEKPSSKSVLALSLGIGAVVLTLLGCWGALAGVPAWIVGEGELKDIAAGQAPSAGSGYAQAGKIMGLVCTVLSAIALVAMIFFGAAILAFIAAIIGSAPR